MNMFDDEKKYLSFEAHNVALNPFNNDSQIGNIMMQDSFNNEITRRILFITDLEKMIGRDRVTLRRWWLIGKFPRPVKLNHSTLAWHRDAIEQWIDVNIKMSEV